MPFPRAAAYGQAVNPRRFHHVADLAAVQILVDRTVTAKGRHYGRDNPLDVLDHHARSSRPNWVSVRIAVWICRAISGILSSGIRSRGPEALNETMESRSGSATAAATHRIPGSFSSRSSA